MAQPAASEDTLSGSHGRERRAGGSEAVEDYSKAIYALALRSEGPVSTSALAERLGVSPGTVTSMLKRLAATGLASYEPYRGVELTDEGKRVALETIRHHRLIESYLVEALGMPWDRVHDEAEVLEHYISEELEERIAAALGDPERDIHGDPIPDRKLEVAVDSVVPLAELTPGERGVFARVSDRDPEMLRYLEEKKIELGARLRVTGHQPFGGPLLVEIEGTEHAVGEGLAARMFVAVG